MGSRPTDGIASHASPLGPPGKLIRGRERGRGNVRHRKSKEVDCKRISSAHTPFTFGVVSCWIAEIPWITGRDRPAPARLLQIAQSCGRSWGRGGYSALSISSNSPFLLPFEQQRSFPAAPFGVRRRVLCSATPEEGEWSADRRTLSFFLSRVRGATPALVRRGPVPVRPGPLSALHRGDFRPRTHAGVSGSGTPEPQRLPAPGRTAWRSGSGPAAVRFRAAVAGRHSWLRLQVVSGDVPS
jgi:hypothetical protein